MTQLLHPALVLAVEAGHISADHPWAKVAVPLGIIIFFGPIFLLLRSNLGTRRGYLVFGSCLWGFTAFLSLFWAFGAPGTPQATGPQNLPGQSIQEYVPTWVPFAPDSDVASRSAYADVVASYPDGFGTVPEAFAAEASIGAGEIQGFFSDEARFSATGFAAEAAPLPATYVLVDEELRYAEATNGYPVIAATFQETYQLMDPEEEGGEPVEPPAVAAGDAEIGDPVPDGETVQLFAFFDDGTFFGLPQVLFPAMAMAGLTGLLFVLHMFLLYRDEQRERHERRQLVPQERERVTADA